MAEHGLNLRLPAVFKPAVRAGKLLALGLLFLLLSVAILGVTSVLQGAEWPILWKSLLLGLLLGWMLALWRRSPIQAVLIAVMLGLVYALLFPGGLGGKLVTSLAETFRLGWEAVSSPQGIRIDWSLVTVPMAEFFTSSGVVFERVWLSLVDSQADFDPVATALIWSLLTWSVAAWAGWVLEARQNVLLAVLPALSVSIGTLSYSGRMSFLLYPMLGTLLMLLAIVQYNRREQEWVELDIAYPKEKGRQTFTVALLVTSALVFMAALFSAVSIQRIQGWISDRGQPAAQQDTQPEKPRKTIQSTFETLQRPGLPQSHLIGSGPELSQNVVMTVSVQNLASLSEKRVPLYWRSFTYDRYTGHGWETSQVGQSRYAPDERLRPAQAPGQVLIRQEIHPVENLGVVYANGELVEVSLQSEVARRSSNDLFGVRLENASPVTYTADSLVPVVDEQTLRAAGQDYPDWIRQRYLALPSSVPDRVRTLAVTLTASAATPYDRAYAIEQYLRTFPYTLDVPHPPANQDVADYFLFDLKKGYCDYYATTMVVLARAAGVPARLVTGYASGTYNLNSERFVVTEADSHSWVEVYFPEIGWVPFEPTAGSPALERSGQVPAQAIAEPAFLPPSPIAGQSQVASRIWTIALSGLVLMILLGAAWLVFDEFRLQRLPNQAAAAEVYRRLKRRSAFLKIASERGATVYEFAALLSARLHQLASRLGKADFGTCIASEVESIANEIVQISYRSGSDRTLAVLSHWKTLRWRLWAAWALQSCGVLRLWFLRRLTDIFPHSHPWFEEES